MLLALQLFVCAIFTLAICFFLGKRWGERKFLKIREEMKAYETAYTQLIEQMEMVSKHNLKILETKTEEMKDFIPAIDKKLLYANDLIQELENLRNETSRISKMKTESSGDLKLRRDVQEMISEISVRIKDLENRIQLIEKIERDRSGAVRKNEVEAVSRMIGSGEGNSKEEVFTHSVQTSVEMQVSSANLVAKKECILQAASVVENPLPRELRTAQPKPGSILHEVLALREKGVPLPQIARKLNIEHGEVEVIMNIYGSRPSMRKLS